MNMKWNKINESDDNEIPVIGIRLVKIARKRGRMPTWVIEKWDEEENRWGWSKSIDGRKSEAIKELIKETKGYFDLLLWRAKHRETN